MPYKDPQKKIDRMKKWRKKAHTPAYMRWLHLRRTLRFQKADRYEATLKRIADGWDLDLGEVRLLANNVLDEMVELERKVGNRFDHERDKGVWVPVSD